MRHRDRWAPSPCFAELARGHAVYASKRTGHVALIGESASNGNIRQRHRREQQQVGGFLQSAELDQLTRRAAKVSAKCSREVNGMHSHGQGQFADTEILRVAVLQQFICPIEPLGASTFALAGATRTGSVRVLRRVHQFQREGLQVQPAVMNAPCRFPEQGPGQGSAAPISQKSCAFPGPAVRELLKPVRAD